MKLEVFYAVQCFQKEQNITQANYLINVWKQISYRFGAPLCMYVYMCGACVYVFLSLQAQRYYHKKGDSFIKYITKWITLSMM